MMTTRGLLLVGGAGLVFGVAGAAHAQVAVPVQQPAPAAAAQPDNVGPMLQLLRQSAAQLRTYEWTETKVMRYKGEEKSRVQNRCRYLSDGSIARVPIGTPVAASSPPGLRGRVAANRREDITEYMERANTLLRRYVPPDAERLRQLRDSGRVTIHLVQPGRLSRLEFRDYLLAGDTVFLDLDLTNNRPSAMRISSYLESPQDRVGLTVRLDALANGMIYVAETTLDAPAKEVRVIVSNSEHHNTGS